MRLRHPRPSLCRRVLTGASSPTLSCPNLRAAAGPSVRCASSIKPYSTASPPPPRPKSRPAPKPKPPPFPTVPTCPAATCGCAPMPEGMDIDHKSPLNGVMSGYAEQVLVCTGRDDWPSKIEEESGGDNLAADLKELFGRGGTYSDPFHNVSILNASFPSTESPRPEVQTTSAYLLPSFKYVPYLPRVSFDAVRALAKGYLLPTKLHAAHDGLSPLHRDHLTRAESPYAGLLPSVRDVDEVLVLICGHGGRDVRCGVMGPLLREEFEDKVGRVSAQLEVRTGPVQIARGSAEPALEDGDNHPPNSSADSAKTGVRVGLISHIGGHKFAGNVIIYIPPSLQVDGRPHPLAGQGIWYGRVEPRHVEGIVRETVVKGNVVEDMFRGGIDRDRRILRL